jgi:putative hydrolase of HD superfamily
MTKLERLHLPYLLKEVQRTNIVGDRRESSAEHTYTTIILCEYFLKNHPFLDRDRVILMALYHDLPEIYAGDAFILDKKKREKKQELEMRAAKKLSMNLPSEISNDFTQAWKEYLEEKTTESKFVHAMDALDSIVQAIKHKEEWKRHNFTDFPIIMQFFNETVEELKRKKIIPKERGH